MSSRIITALVCVSPVLIGGCTSAPSSGSSRLEAPAAEPSEPEAPQPVPASWRPVGLGLLTAFDVEPLMEQVRELEAKNVADAITQGLPAAIRELVDQRVELRGYMIPVDFDRHRVGTFLLVEAFPGSQVPGGSESLDSLTSCVFVRVPSETSVQFSIYAVTVRGRLRLSQTAEPENRMSVYRLELERFEVDFLLSRDGGGVLRHYAKLLEAEQRFSRWWWELKYGELEAATMGPADTAVLRGMLEDLTLAAPDRGGPKYAVRFKRLADYAFSERDD